MTLTVEVRTLLQSIYDAPTLNSTRSLAGEALGIVPTYKTYALENNGVPIYVGKSRHPEERLRTHLANPSNGLRPHVSIETRCRIVGEYLSNEEALKAELFLYDSLRKRGYTLHQRRPDGVDGSGGPGAAHGTQYMYHKKGCRCADCVAWHERPYPR